MMVGMISSFCFVTIVVLVAYYRRQIRERDRRIVAWREDYYRLCCRRENPERQPGPEAQVVIYLVRRPDGQLVGQHFISLN